MSKRVLLWLIIVMLAGGTIAFIRLQTARLNKAQAEAGKPIIEQARAEAAGKRLVSDETAPPVLAPLELKHPVRLALGSLGLADEEQNGRLSDLVLGELNGAQGLDLVERQSLEAVLSELNLSLSGLVRARDAVRVGKLLKVDWFLLGTAAKINGANSIVIRVVDARTGILRDAGVFPGGKPMAQLAGDIAAFARQSRQNAAVAKSPVFLAIGALQDLSVNNRQAAFPNQLRGYLTAAYQGGKVTLLEREYVETLLQEARLDLAGLTEESATNAPAPMQSAYWLVSGCYQSFETTNIEVEMTLEVQRIFGLTKQVTLRGPVGEPVNRQVKEAIDKIMDQNQGMIVSTRMSEVRAQMHLGKELSRVVNFKEDPDLVFPQFRDSQYFDSDTGNLIPQTGLKRRRNLEEAIRAFETVLLLDAGNREAKMYLAACFRSPIIQRDEEARHEYREIIEAGVQDRWSGLAQRALVASFRNRFSFIDADGEARWFEAAAQQAIHSPEKDFYSKQAKAAEADATVMRGESSEAESMAEQRMFDELRSYRDKVMKKGKSEGVDSELRMHQFVQTLGEDRAAAARRLVEMLPKMRREAPELEPYFLSAVVTFQVDTNAPVIAELQRYFTRLSEHPEQVFGPVAFWHNMRSLYLRRWCFEHKLYSLAALVAQGEMKAADMGNPCLEDDHYKNESRIALAYAYLGLGQWQQARDIFETYSNQSFVMYDRGPWGIGWNMVLTGKEAAFCAEKLGQTPARDPREFDMGKACFCLCTPSAFVVDESGLWIGIDSRLLRLDFDLKTNLEVVLPKNNDTAICCLCPTAQSVWIGTDGEGLIEYDKTSRKCRRLTEKDGLLMDYISCLNPAGDKLWIGYGHRNYRFSASWAGGTHEGGLGRLDLSTRQFTAFTPSLKDRRMMVQKEAAKKPTSRPVIVLANGSEDDVWFITDSSWMQLRRYRTRDNTWEAGPTASSSLAIDSKRLFLGQYWWNSTREDKSDQLGVRILDFKDGKWRTLKTTDPLPPGAVSAVAPDGNDLWVGGRSYIAVVDLEQEKVRKFARVKADAVDEIQIGGGYLWALYDWHVHRALLENLR